MNAPSPWQEPNSATAVPGLETRPSQMPVPYAGGHPPVVTQPDAVGLQMKLRNPFAAWIGLPLITLGIYHFVWYYKIHREMSEFDRRRNIPVAGPMLVLLFLSWTVIAPLVSYFNTGNRIRNAQRAAGLRESCSGLIGLLLMFVFGLGTLYYQFELNKIVEAYGVPEGTQIPLHA